ncbi:MAG: GNAT family N-acetyltransferase [Chitinophagaceae bacterium]|nr:MAG: GNAT family N-acetyltransferase [Chitinophagaceae bacterium]
MLLIALAAAPGLAICLYVFIRDVHNPEPVRYLVASFALGATLTVPAYFLEKGLSSWLSADVPGILLQSFIAIALVEELLKFLVLRYFCFRLPSFDEPLDGIIYSIMVSMGFATLENVAYTWMHGAEVLIGRTFTSVPAHACFAAIMGYYAGLARFETARRGALLRTGLLRAILFHGCYDSFILLTENRWLKQYVSEALLLTGAIYSLFVALRLSRRLFRQHRHTSRQLFVSDPTLSLRVADERDLPMIEALARATWPAAFRSFLSDAQIAHMLDKQYSTAALLDEMKEGHHFLVVSNAGVPVGFAAYGALDEDRYQLHKLYVLPGHQGRGAGRVLLEAVLRQVSGEGATELRLRVNRSNAAVKFYERLGFHILRSQDVDIGNGYFMNDYVMVKEIVNRQS